MATGKRELTDTGPDKRYVRRDENGRFETVVDVGKSLSQGASKPPPFKRTMPWSSASRNARSSGWMFFFRYSTASSPMFLRAQNSRGSAVSTIVSTR